jgi:YfiR/HmsC-like
VFNSRTHFTFDEYLQMSTRLHHEYIFTRRRAAFTVLIFCVCLGARQAWTQMVEESQVKAAYLYNFVKFVEWPPGVFRDPAGPAVICVVGDPHMSNLLEQAVSSKKANGRPVETRRPHLSAEFKSCQIVFIAFSDKDRIAEILDRLRGASVLTVGQSNEFIPLGGMINMAIQNSRITLEIDPEASTAVGLKISSRLLVVARLVAGSHGTGGER